MEAPTPPGTPEGTDQPRQRLRFHHISLAAAPESRCEVTVGLEWRGRVLEGRGTGFDTHHGRVRASAEATLEAAMAGARRRIHLELLGVKAVRAFDGWVVVARLGALVGERSLKLLGAASCEDEAALPRAAALAVLDGTNRVLEREVRG